MRLAVTVVAVLVAGLGLGAGNGAVPSSEQARATTVRVRMVEWSMPPQPARVRAGRITFVVRNAGRLRHEFVVLRTNRRANSLPMRGSRAREIGRVGKIPQFAPGKTRRLTLTLRRGRYVILCNLPAHYRAGQFAVLRVT